MHAIPSTEPQPNPTKQKLESCSGFGLSVSQRKESLLVLSQAAGTTFYTAETWRESRKTKWPLDLFVRYAKHNECKTQRAMTSSSSWKHNNIYLKGHCWALILIPHRGALFPLSPKDSRLSRLSYTSQIDPPLSCTAMGLLRHSHHRVSCCLLSLGLAGWFGRRRQCCLGLSFTWLLEV